jgi:hypothetical protein
MKQYHQPIRTAPVNGITRLGPESRARRPAQWRGSTARMGAGSRSAAPAARPSAVRQRRPSASRRDANACWTNRPSAASRRAGPATSGARCGRRRRCNSTSSWTRFIRESKSRRFHASMAARTISTFSFDIAYPLSAAASRASSAFGKPGLAQATNGRWAVPGSNQRPPACKAAPTPTTPDDAGRRIPLIDTVCGGFGGIRPHDDRDPRGDVWATTGPRLPAPSCVPAGGLRTPYRVVVLRVHWVLSTPDRCRGDPALCSYG